jgi:hypothetical protein
MIPYIISNHPTLGGEREGAEGGGRSMGGRRGTFNTQKKFDGQLCVRGNGNLIRNIHT